MTSELPHGLTHRFRTTEMKWQRSSPLGVESKFPWRSEGSGKLAHLEQKLHKKERVSTYLLEELEHLESSLSKIESKSSLHMLDERRFDKLLQIDFPRREKKRLYCRNISLNRLGPGSYNIQSPNTGSSFLFSRHPRFDYHKKLESLFVRNRHNSNSEIIRRNKNLKDFLPMNKFDKIVQKAKVRSVKELSCQKTKILIEKEKSDKLRIDLHEKQLKLKMRLNRSEYNKIFKSWNLLFTIIGLKNCVQFTVEYRKSVNKRAKLLIMVVKAIGKFKVCLIRSQKRRSLHTIGKLMGPYLLKKASTIRKEYTGLLQRFILKVVSGGSLAIAYDKWRNSLLKIQKATKRFIVVSRTKRETAFVLWEMVWNLLVCEDKTKKEKTKVDGKLMEIGFQKYIDQERIVFSRENMKLFIQNFIHKSDKKKLKKRLKKKKSKKNALKMQYKSLNN